MDISAKDIVRIIGACKRSGVSELKLGSLELKFVAGEAAPASVVTSDIVRAPTDQELKQIEDKVSLTERLDTADDELAHMQVEDPARFEELLVNRELEYSGSTAENGY